MNIPRVIIAGTQSGVGKTTISIGLMGALKEAGYTVQGFKVGPDYIDPSYHNAVTGRLSENLDVWLAPKEQIVEFFSRAVKGANFAVIEGVMGLYDSVSGTDETGSTSQIAKLLNCPVILVIDAHNMVRTAGAIALGFKTFDRKVQIKGIILNNVAGRTHADWCRDAIFAATGLPVVGWLPVNDKVQLPERYLGLVPTPEKDSLKQGIPKITNFIKTYIDVNQVVELAKSAKTLPRPSKTIYLKKPLKKTVRIGYAFDEAFNFYYPSNLSLLENYGAQMVCFSPIHDKSLPEKLDGIYFGGGFPEQFLKELEANENIRKQILESINKGMPVYGECAGLMYLTKTIADLNGNSYHMIGALDGNTVMTNNTLLTYSLAEATSNNILSAKGTQLRGHEFHNSIIENIPADSNFAYKMLMGEGIIAKKDGWTKNNVLASYTHIHFGQDQKIVTSFIESCRMYGRIRSVRLG